MNNKRPLTQMQKSLISINDLLINRRINGQTILLVFYLMFWISCDINSSSHNTIPSISKISAEPYSIEPGGISIVTCFATDGDGDSLTYLWSATCGSIRGVGSIVTYTASMTEEICIIVCTVSDSNGGEDSQSISIITVSQSLDWVTVPAGPYTFGIYDEVLNDIDYDFQIMKFEVTNIKYIQYLAEALALGNITVTSTNIQGPYEGDEIYSAGNQMYLDMTEPSLISWDGNSFSIVPGYENHPVVFVTWFGAIAYAKHYNLKLPSDHEWEKAARGNTGYEYSWGNDIDGSRCNYLNSNDPYEKENWAVQPQTTPVGYYNGSNYNGFQTLDSPSQYGVYDMTGNVYEWCNSWYNISYSYRGFRGGAWISVTNNLPSWVQYGTYPHNGYIAIGFRCINSN